MPAAAAVLPPLAPGQEVIGDLFSVVIPVYRNEDTLSPLVAALDPVADQMEGGLEAVFVVDGSPDSSLDVLLSALPRARFRSQVITLSRNFGSFSAIVAGITHARGSHIAVMAADLQEPPELLLAFRDGLITGRHDVVVGTRTARDDPFFARLTSAMFWRCYRALIQREMPPGGVDVFAGTRAFMDTLLSLHERNTTLIGLVFWLGFSRAEIPYARRRRLHGKSAWSVSRRIRYLLDSAFAFSDLPLKLMSLVGFCGLALSLILGATVLYARLRGSIPVPGYSATVLTVMFFGALNSLGIGLIGEYVWRTFENTKGRPPYVIARAQTFGAPEAFGE